MAESVIKKYFPSQVVSAAEKLSYDYGLKVAKAIEAEWFDQDRGHTRHTTNQNDFHNLRLYARGEQSIQKYKDELSINGDLSYLNLDWKPVPIIPKFVDIVVNGMNDRLFDVKAYAQDALSAQHRSEYQDMIEGQMAAKPILEVMSQDFQIDPFTMDADDLPESDEELDLYMQLNYKPAIEIAEEEAINTILEENHYLDVRKRVDYDLTVLGIGIAKHEFLPGAGVKLSYVDPANVVYSYTEDPHFKDCFYWGEIKTVPIIELLKIDTTLTN